MSETTPGQIAYEAFAAAMTRKHASWGMSAFADLRPAPDYQAAWEAAAQAVLALEPRAGFILSRAELEHLLNCLANQKFLHEMAEPLRDEAQALIDMAWRKGMDWLTHGPQEDTP